MKRGFTLIEVMIVVAILGTVVGSTLMDPLFFIRKPASLSRRIEATGQESRLLARLAKDVRQSVLPVEGELVPGVLELRGPGGTIEYALDRQGYLLRLEREQGQLRRFRRMLSYPLASFEVEPAWFSSLPPRSGGRVSLAGCEGVRVRLLGGRGLFSAGHTLAVAWRGGAR